ncbi:MAG: glycosyltransferase [Vulcanimicrobiaceae bacterium]
MPVRIRSNRPAQPKPASALPQLPFGLPAPPADWVQKPAGLSLCMIVKNEERFLEECLRSIAGSVDEINIVDTGSTDGTLDIARRFGARIEHREWREDFAWARNESLAMATRRWIIQLDADEELLPESLEALALLKNVPAYLTGIWIRCINRSDQYHGSGQLSHVITRVFPNHERVRFTGPIHEFVSVDKSTRGIDAVHSPIKILHHGYMSSIVNDRNKFARNLSIIEAAIEKEPEDAFHWYNLGVTCYLQGDDRRAADAFERMWHLCKDELRGFTPNGLQIWADTLNERLNDPERGLEIALLCLKHAPRYANAHFSAGKSLMLLKRFDESRAMYETAIADAEHMDKQFVVDDEVPAWKAHSEIGATYAMEGDDLKALEWFDRGLANRPNVGPLRLNRARALVRLGRLDEAEAMFRRLYEEIGDEQSTLNLVNFLLQHQKERDALPIIDAAHGKLSNQAAVTLLIAGAAIEQRYGGSGESYLRLAQELAPGSAEVLNPLEAIYQQRGDAQAVETLRAREREAPPQQRPDYLRRSQLHLADRDYQAAHAMADRGLQANPLDGPLSYNAAIALVNLARKEEALRHLEAIDVNAGVAAYLQGKHLQSVLLRDLGRHEAALAAADAALEHDAGQLDTALVRAGLLEQLGRMDDAERALTALLPVSKQRVAVELAGLYLRSGRVLDAKRVAEEALA